MIRSAEYWLTIFPKSVGKEEVVLGTEFTGIVKPYQSPAGEKKVLLDQDVSIPVGKTILIGFPQISGEKSRGPCLRGEVYILALNVDSIR